MIIFFLKIFFAILGAGYTAFLTKDVLKNKFQKDSGSFTAGALIGGGANFLDTLGIGSFAISTVLLRTFRQVTDKLLPGTLNAMCPLPTIVETLIFLQFIEVDQITLISMTITAAIGGWLGALYVVKLPEQKIRFAMSIALIITASFMLSSELHILPAATHDALGLTGIKLIIAIVCSLFIGSLTNIGIGFYAPCLSLVYILGMSAKAAFPIMMSCCAISTLFAGIKFVKAGAYNRKIATAMLAAGVVGVLIAAYIVKSLPLHVLIWIVIGVVYYAAFTLMRTYFKNKKVQIPTTLEPVNNTEDVIIADNSEAL